jgi:ribosomal protein L16 Arg81 hydroxylase
MKHQFVKNFWSFLPSWEAVLEDLQTNKIDGSFIKQTENDGFVTHRGERIFEVAALMEYIKKLNPHNNYVDAHIYISLSKFSKTFGKHEDPMDVYFIQAQGQTEWIITENNIDYTYILNPSDMVYIPQGIFHNPKPLTPRIGLSIGTKYVLYE